MGESGLGIDEFQSLVRDTIRLFQQDRTNLSGYVGGVVLPRLEDVLKQISSEIDYLHHLDSGSGTNYVVHYTSIDTVISLLENASQGKPASLRLYDSVHFNDPEEGNYLSACLPQKHGWALHTEPSHAYVASFIIPDAKNKDDASNSLMFWRTYGQEGLGCSLRVNVASSQLRRVLYGKRHAQRAIVKLRPVLDSLKPLASMQEDVRQMLASQFWEYLGRVRYLYKSEAYQYERECRLVVYFSDAQPKDICFERKLIGDGRVLLRHYHEHNDLTIQNMVVSGSRITIGPCVSDATDLCRSLEILRDRAGLTAQLSVTRSGIPYRRF